MPVDIPTVFIAETASNTTSVGSSSGCMPQMAVTPMKVMVRLNAATERAFLGISSSSRLPKRLMSSSFLMLATAARKSTATVTVFTPPAVEPGLPPMNM